MRISVIVNAAIGACWTERSGHNGSGRTEATLASVDEWSGVGGLLFALAEKRAKTSTSSGAWATRALARRSDERGKPDW